MTPTVHRFRGVAVRPTAAVAVTLSLVAATLLFSVPVAAASTINCAAAVTSAPTGPATVSVATRQPFGRVLVVGAGDEAGCSLYLLTSDEVHRLTGAPYACSDGPNATGAPCDSVLWPALLTRGAPIAGPGVNRHLLGTVTRTDLPGLGAVRQVTYAGLPLYRFVFDEAPGETEGANLFDPVTSPTGTWYLVDPRRGQPAPGRASLSLESAPLNGTGPVRTVLAATMNNDFSLFPDVNFPVYTLSTEREHGRDREREGDRDHGRRTSACGGLCAAVYWPPVLTSGRPIAGPGIDRRALGTVRRPDGTLQVTYRGRPLYFYFGDAYIQPIPGTGIQGIFGAGLETPWGEFNTIPRS
jgi:predicted lipoprotein with Yx(FWY)xxD motif